jgi:hypothetical protein
VIEIVGNGIGDFIKEEKASPQQLVLTFKDSTVAEIARQTFDPSSELPNSPLVQISSYPFTDLDARVVLDFKSKLQYKIDANDRKITIRIPNSAEKPAVAIQRERQPELKASDLDPLTTIMSAETDQKFTGSPITLKLKDADVHEVLRLISDASGFNIVIHPQVNGKLTLSLEQVPWDQALDVVLTTLRLAAERKDSVLRVMPRDQLINPGGSENHEDFSGELRGARDAPIPSDHFCQLPKYHCRGNPRDDSHECQHSVPHREGHGRRGRADQKDDPIARCANSASDH